MSRGKILIVEDEFVVAEYLKSRLESMDYEVSGLASSSDQAMELARKENPDLALMDIKILGGMDGIDTAILLRQELDVPVVFLTAFSDECLLERASLAEPLGYLVKPFEPKGFEACIKMAHYKARTERLLKENKTMLQRVFDGVSTPQLMLDGDMRVRLLNRAAKDHYGLGGCEDARGKLCWELRGKEVPCEGCERPLSSLRGYAGSFERRSPFDASRIEEVVFYPAGDEKGNGRTSIVRIEDVTLAKATQKTFVSNQKLAALGLLVPGLTHEINNPNNFLFFNLPILKDYLEFVMRIVDEYAEANPGLELFHMTYGEFRKDVFELLENMWDGVQRIDRIVSGLKELDNKEEHARWRTIDLRHVLERAAEICNAEIRKTVRTFDMDIPEDLPPIVSDSGILEKILVRLLTNAAQAADKEASWIGVRAFEEGASPRCVVIEVSDNGCGMDKQTMEKIFDPFFTTRAAKMGIGLGLYACRNLAKELGGCIEVESEPGVGSTFRLVLGGGGLKSSTARRKF